VSGVTFITYLWHYLVGRLIYDSLIRGHAGVLVAVLVLGAIALAWRARRRRK
jgi:hypothetical protein